MKKFLRRLFNVVRGKTELNTNCIRCKEDTTKNGWYIGQNKTLCIKCGPHYVAEKRQGIRYI